MYRMEILYSIKRYRQHKAFDLNIHTHTHPHTHAHHMLGRGRYWDAVPFNHRMMARRSAVDGIRMNFILYAVHPFYLGALLLCIRWHFTIGTKIWFTIVQQSAFKSLSLTLSLFHLLLCMFFCVHYSLNLILRYISGNGLHNGFQSYHQAFPVVSYCFSHVFFLMLLLCVHLDQRKISFVSCVCVCEWFLVRCTKFLDFCFKLRIKQNKRLTNTQIPMATIMWLNKRTKKKTKSNN